MEPLTALQLQRLATTLPNWTCTAAALERSYRFPDFATAIAFLGECVEPIEALAHHPDWRNVYDRVEVRLTTHDAGNRVTTKDVELAKTLDWVAGRFLP